MKKTIQDKSNGFDYLIQEKNVANISFCRSIFKDAVISAAVKSHEGLFNYHQNRHNHTAPLPLSTNDHIHCVFLLRDLMQSDAKSDPKAVTNKH